MKSLLFILFLSCFVNAFSQNTNYTIFYEVVADTSSNYYQLQQEMFSLNKKQNIPIDTLERYYNKDMDLIMLPESHADELYAGSYIPRRFPAESLCLEYLNYYHDALKKQ